MTSDMRFLFFLNPLFLQKDSSLDEEDDYVGLRTHVDLTILSRQNDSKDLTKFVYFIFPLVASLGTLVSGSIFHQIGFHHNWQLMQNS